MRTAGGTPGRPPVQVQVGPAGQVRQETGPFHERAQPGQRRRAGTDLLAEDRDRPGVRVDQAHQRAQRGGLPGAVRPQEAEDLAPLHAQRQPVHRELAVPVALGQTGDLQGYSGITGDHGSGPQQTSPRETSPCETTRAPPPGQQDHRRRGQRGDRRGPGPPGRAAPRDLQRRIRRHGQVRGGQRHPVGRCRPRRGVAEIGAGQDQAEPVSRGELVVHRGQRHGDGPAWGRPAAGRTVCRTGYPHRRGQAERQRGVPGLINVVYRGEDGDVRGATEPDPDGGRAGLLQRRGERGRGERGALAGHREAQRRPSPGRAAPTWTVARRPAG